MERVLAKLMAWKGIYDELGRLQSQINASVDAGNPEAQPLKDEAAQLVIRSDAALEAVQAALQKLKSARS